MPRKKRVFYNKGTDNGAWKGRRSLFYKGGQGRWMRPDSGIDQTGVCTRSAVCLVWSTREEGVPRLLTMGYMPSNTGDSRLVVLLRLIIVNRSFTRMWDWSVRYLTGSGWNI